jgi:hypothetical protein
MICPADWGLSFQLQPAIAVGQHVSIRNAGKWFAFL